MIKQQFPGMPLAWMLCAMGPLVGGGCSEANSEPPPASAPSQAQAKHEMEAPQAQAQAQASAQAMPMAAASKAHDIDVSAFTSAPLRYSTQVHLDAKPDAVWALVSDHEALPTYFAPVKTVTVDNSKATRENGVGAVRSCNLMGQDLREDIRLFEPGRALGYSVVHGGVPGVTDHFGLVSLRPDGDGTLLTWSQYFDHPEPEPVVKQIGGLLGMAETGLIEKFGGRAIEAS